MFSLRWPHHNSRLKKKLICMWEWWKRKYFDRYGVDRRVPNNKLRMTCRQSHIIYVTNARKISNFSIGERLWWSLMLLWISPIPWRSFSMTIDFRSHPKSYWSAANFWFCVCQFEKKNVSTQNCLVADMWNPIRNPEPFCAMDSMSVI